MKNLHHLIIGLFLVAFSMSTVFSQAVLLISDLDDYKVVVKRIQGGVPEITSPEPDKLLYVENSFNWLSQGLAELKVRINKNGPVDLSMFHSIPAIAYGIASIDVETNTASIDLDLWGNNPFHIAEALTESSQDINTPGPYMQFPQFSSTLSAVTNDYIEVNVRVNLPALCEQCAYEFREIHLLASGIIPTDLVIWDTELLGEGYAEADGNKGVTSAHAAGEWYAWINDNWKNSDGHYADLRFYTNGTRKDDPGIDLSEYTKLTVTMMGKNGMTVEAFMGAGESDSYQKFLQDIHCDDFTHTYEWDITGFDKTNIQNVLWLHIPTWKNTELGQEYRLWMNIDKVILSKE